MSAKVQQVHLSPEHTMSKRSHESIVLVAGRGVEGDAHFGETVKHRSRVRRDPTQPNLRQVHLIHSELFSELERDGFTVTPGMMGENITTVGIDLLAQPTGTIMKFPSGAAIELTGLRNPCAQIDGLEPGLMQAVLDRDVNGDLVRKAGVMSIVVTGGAVTVGDGIEIEQPPGESSPLRPV